MIAANLFQWQEVPCLPLYWMEAHWQSTRFSGFHWTCYSWTYHRIEKAHICFKLQLSSLPFHCSGVHSTTTFLSCLLYLVSCKIFTLNQVVNTSSNSFHLQIFYIIMQKSLENDPNILLIFSLQSMHSFVHMHNWQTTVACSWWRFNNNECIRYLGVEICSFQCDHVGSNLPRPMAMGRGCCFLNSKKCQVKEVLDLYSICRNVMLRNTDLNFKIVKEIYDDLVTGNWAVGIPFWHPTGVLWKLICNPDFRVSSLISRQRY